MNGFKTLMLLAAMTALFMALGYTLGGSGGAVMALVMAAAMNLFTFWNADKIVLKMHKAREVDGSTAPEFVAIVKQLASRAGLPMPKVYLVDSPHPNAFATGRNPQNAAVAATTGLLSILDRDEVAAVMAHELAHVKNRVEQAQRSPARSRPYRIGVGQFRRPSGSSALAERRLLGTAVVRSLPVTGGGVERPISSAMSWSAAIRFSVAGWVENMLSRPVPLGTM